MSNNKPFTFADIVEMHEELSAADPVFSKMTLPEFSTFAQQSTGADFQMGMRDSKLKRASATVDRWLGASKLPAAGRYLTEGATKMFTDNPKYIEMMGGFGEAIPRGVGTIALAVPGTAAIAAGGLPTALGAAGLGAAGLLGGSADYTATDNPWAGVIGGVSSMITPGVMTAGRAAGAQVAKGFTKQAAATQLGKAALAGTVPSAFAKRIGEKAAGRLERGIELGGDLVAGTILNEATIQATDAVMGNTTPTDEHLMQLFGSQLPFLPFQAHGAIKGPKMLKSGQMADFRSVTDMNSQIQIARNAQAKAVYDAADVERRMKNTQQQSWEPVMDTRGAEPVDTGYVMKGDVKVPKAVVNMYNEVLLEHGKYGSSLSAKKFAKRYGVSIEAANEVMNAVEQRGIVSQDVGDGTRVTVADVNPSAGTVVGNAIAAHPDTVHVKIKPVQKVAEEPVVSEVAGGAATLPASEGILPGAENIGKVDSDATVGQPEGKATPSDPIVAEAKMQPEELRIRQEIDARIQAGADPNSPEIKTLMEPLMKYEESKAKALAKGKPVPKFRKVKARLADTNSVVKSQLDMAGFKNDPGISAALALFKEKISPVDAIIASLDEVDRRVETGVESRSLDEVDKSLAETRKELNDMDEAAADRLAADTLVEGGPESEAQMTSRLADKLVGEKSKKAQIKEEFRRAMGAKQQGAKQRGMEVAAPEPEVGGKPVLDLTSEERVAMSVQLAAKLKAKSDEYMSGYAKLAETGEELQLHIDQQHLANAILSRFQLGESPIEAVAKAENMLSFMIAERVNQLRNQFARRKEAEYERQRRQETVMRPDEREKVDASLALIHAGEVPPEALALIVQGAMGASANRGGIDDFSYHYGVSAWVKLGKPKSEMLKSADGHLTELGRELEGKTRLSDKFLDKMWDSWEKRKNADRSTESLEKITEERGDVIGGKETAVEDDVADVTVAVVDKNTLDIVSKDDITPETFEVTEVMTQEFEAARKAGTLTPDISHWNDWAKKHLGYKQSVAAKMQRPLTVLVESLHDGVFVAEPYNGRLRFRFVPDNDLGVTLKEIAEMSSTLVNPMTETQYLAFLKNNGYKFLEAYLKEVAPKTVAHAEGNILRAKARHEAAELFEKRKVEIEREVTAERESSMEGVGAKPLEESQYEPPKATASVVSPVTRDQAGAAGVDPRFAEVVTDKYVMQAGTIKFFTRFYKQRGYSSAEAVQMSDLAVRMVSAVKHIDTGRIAQLIEGTTVAGGLAWPTAKRWSPLMGMGSYAKDKHLPGFVEFAQHYTLAHETIHMTVDALMEGANGPEGRAKMVGLLGDISHMTPMERQIMVSEWNNMVLPESVRNMPESQAWVQSRAEAAFKDEHELLADYGALLVMGTAMKEGSKVEYVKDMLKFSSPAEQDFAKGVYVKVADLSESLAHYFNHSSEAKVDGTLQMGDAYTQMHGKAVGMLRTLKESEEAYNGFQRLMYTDPDGFVKALESSKLHPLDVRLYDAMRHGAKGNPQQTAALKSMVKDVGGHLGFGDQKDIQHAFGQDPSFIEKQLFPAAQLAARYPLLKPVLDLAFTFRGRANDMAEKVLMPFLGRSKTVFGKETSRLGIDEEMGGLKVVLSDEGANKAASKIALAENMRESVMSDSEMRATMVGLDPVKQQAVIDFHRAVEKAEGHMADVRLRSEADRTINMTVRMLQLTNKEMKATDAGQVGKEIALYAYKMYAKQPNAAIADIIAQVPDVGSDMAVKWAELQQRAGGQAAFLAAQRTAMTRWKGYVQLEGVLYNQDGTHRNWYQSEVRLGQFYVSWKDSAGKFVDSRGFDDQREAAAYVRTLEAKGFTVKATNKWQQGEHLSGMDGRLVKAYSEQERMDFEEALKILGANSPDMDQFGKFYNGLKAIYTPGAGSEKLLTGQGYGRYGLQAKRAGGAGGREEINMPRGFFEQVETMTTGLARARTKELAAIALDDTEMRSNPALQNYGADHLQSVLSPPGREWTGTKNVIFNWFLGFNVSSMLIERSQSLLTVAPQLVRDGGSISESYKYLYRGATEKQGKGGTYVDPMIEAAVQRAYKNQVIDFGLAQELHNSEDVSIHNVRALAQGGEFSKMASFVTTPVKMYAQIARSLYSNSTKWNAKMTFVAGVRFATEKLGKSPDAAYDYAVDLVRTTNYSGGVAARPGFFHGLGKTHGAVGAMYALQSYTFSAIAQMSRYGLDSISTHVAPEHRVSARKALGQMMFTQVALSGAMGLPMAGGIVALLEELFPNMEPKKNVRVWLSKMFTDDAKTGGVIADIAMNGFANQSGVDVASRVGLGNFLGINSQEGFSGKNILGPGYGLGESAVKGVKYAAGGEPGKAVETMLPNAYKNFVKLKNDEYKFRDERGRLLFEGTDTEKALYAFGLKPAKLARIREEQRLVQASDDVAQVKMTKFHNQVADMMQAGDVRGARTMLLQRQQSDPMYEARAGARKVVDMLQERAIPVQPGASGMRGNAVERAGISATFAGTKKPSEVERLMQAKQLERAFQFRGLGQVSKSELTKAQAVDRLMQMYPGTSRQMAVRIVDQSRAPLAGQPRLQAGLP